MRHQPTDMIMCLQTAASDSADDSGSDVATPNTVYAREVAQLFVSGRHNQFRDATTRFGSLEGSRTMSSRALLAQAQAPTPSLPSSESIGDFACLLLPGSLSFRDSECDRLRLVAQGAPVKGCPWR